MVCVVVSVVVGDVLTHTENEPVTKSSMAPFKAEAILLQSVSAAASELGAEPHANNMFNIHLIPSLHASSGTPSFGATSQNLGLGVKSLPGPVYSVNTDTRSTTAASHVVPALPPTFSPAPRMYPPPECSVTLKIAFAPLDPGQVANSSLRRRTSWSGDVLFITAKS